ncbi:toll/interleukin-1 receptor domain-containing protein [Neorhizobium galegae]|nr:toll/interleukin-1 receptor domain-containing protein [Neorhizobium galegae]MCQ1781353.1 toll/interleukin-1 receptor domain-containing protein [Neorhizobium galegae]MCQ1797510.1 toll/interleukin-1 receptor domain-containing protein [Neorhizobium galegae]
MARCTAPVRGHTGGGAANCPACSSRYGRSSFGSYGSSYNYSSSSPSYSSSGGGGGGRSGGGSSKTSKPRWARPSSAVWYTPAEVRELEPVREQVERRATVPDLRDVFLCHAWDDRQGAAKELHDLLEARGVKVWFSEKDIALGEPFLREIDRGLAKSRVGIVLVTPSFLKRIHGQSIADKELSVLLHGGKLVPIIHGTTFTALNEESPMLASRNGLNTADDTMADVATKLADLVAV